MCVCVSLYHVCAGWCLCLLPFITPDCVFEALSAENTGWHRSQKAKTGVTSSITSMCYTCSGCSKPPCMFSMCHLGFHSLSLIHLYLSVLLPYLSCATVQPAPGLFPLYPAHTLTHRVNANLQESPPPRRSRSFFIKMLSDWQETYLHIKLTST